MQDPGASVEPAPNESAASVMGGTGAITMKVPGPVNVSMISGGARQLCAMLRNGPFLLGADAPPPCAAGGGYGKFLLTYRP